MWLGGPGGKGSVNGGNNSQMFLTSTSGATQMYQPMASHYS